MGGGSAPTLTKADVANCIVQYDQQKFAVYVGKPGAQAWMCVKGLPDARRRASDMNSVQSVAVREGTKLAPTISFEEWRTQYASGGSDANGGSKGGKAKANGKGKQKGGGGRSAPAAAAEADDLDALVAEIEAAHEEPKAEGEAEEEEEVQTGPVVPPEPIAAPAPAVAAASQPAAPPPRDPATLSIRELKSICAEHGVDTASVLEKCDLLKLALPFLPVQELEAPAPDASPAPPAPDAAPQLLADEADAEAAEAAAREAKRLDIMAQIAAARAAQALVGLEDAGSGDTGRKVNLEDLLDDSEADKSAAAAAAAVAAAASLDAKHRHEADSQVKSYRAQAEFGAKKFIKP